MKALLVGAATSLILVLSPMSVPRAEAQESRCDACAESVYLGSHDFEAAGVRAGRTSGEESSRTRPRNPIRDTAAAAPVKEYDYSPACRGNGVAGEGTGAVDCPAAHNCPDAGALRVVVSERVVGSPGWYRQPGTVCLNTDQQVAFNPADAQAFVDGYFQRLPLPLPGLRVQPAAQAVVNLPELVSADPPPAGVFAVDEAPFPRITINARVRWEWDFGDGGSAVSSWPGRAYDGLDPRTSPDHYVAHTYRARSTGQRVTVTGVWTASWQLAGFPGVRAVDGQVRRVSSQLLPVAAYGAVLTDN